MTLLLLLRQKKRQNSEIRMTASVLKQDPNTKGSEECYLLGQSTTCASFRGKSMRDPVSYTHLTLPTRDCV